MRKLLTSSLVALTLVASSPVLAKSFGFDSTVTEPLNSAVKVEIVLSEDLAHRANNLPKKLSDRSSGSRFRSGFANNGYYGDRELERLSQRLQSKIETKFAKKGISVSDTAPTTLRVTIESAKPNRPTFEQLSRETGLSFKSIGIGGAEITSELIAAGGSSLGTIDYTWYENDIRDARFRGTWGDAYRAFDRYASRAAKTLSRKS